MASSQIRSAERVKALGEVFTAPREVNAMLDLLPPDVWDDPLARFLEPSCGSGNFLVAILERKLAALDKRLGNTTKHAREFGVLLVLSSIYAVDICASNVEESRARLLAMAREHLPDAPPRFFEAASKVLAGCVVVGDFLKAAELAEWSAPWPGLIAGRRVLLANGKATAIDGAAVEEVEYYADPATFHFGQ